MKAGEGGAAVPQARSGAGQGARGGSGGGGGVGGGGAPPAAAAAANEHPLARSLPRSPAGDGSGRTCRLGGRVESGQSRDSVFPCLVSPASLSSGGETVPAAGGPPAAPCLVVVQSAPRRRLPQSACFVVLGLVSGHRGVRFARQGVRPEQGAALRSPSFVPGNYLKTALPDGNGQVRARWLSALRSGGFPPRRSRRA